MVTPGQKGGRGVRLAAALLVVATCLTFAPATVGDFVWDDGHLIVFNDAVRESNSLGDLLTRRFWDVSDDPDGRGERRRYYRPVVILAYTAQLRLFGDEPLGFHIVNLTLHVACVLLAFTWLRRRLGSAAGGWAAAALGAGLFALHPSRPESVSWISGSTDLWMSVFALCGLLLWSRARGWPGRVLALAMFILAMLAKEPAVTVPAALAAEAFIFRSKEGGATALRRALVLAAAVGGAFVARIVLVPPESSLGLGAEPAIALARPLSALGHYVARVVWPWPPTAQAAVIRLDQGYVPVYDPWSVGLGAVVALGLLTLGIVARRRRAARPWLADAVWFVAPLLPAAQILPLGINVLVADRFLYLPMLGVAAMFGRALRPLLAHAGPRRAAAIGAAGAVGLACASVSLWHSGHFLTEDALWTHEYELNPRNDYVVENLAQHRARQGRFEEAVTMLMAAHRDTRQRGLDSVAARHALRAVNVRLQHWPTADQPALIAMRAFLDQVADPETSHASLHVAGLDIELNVAEARLYGVLSKSWFLSTPRAQAYLRTFDPVQAERLAGIVVKEEPASWNARIVLTRSLAWQERWDEALAVFDRGAAKRMHDPSTGRLRAQLLSARAAATRRAGLGHVEETLGRAEGLLVMGATEPARRLLDIVLRQDPDRAEAWLLRAVADAADGLRDRALWRLREASARFPDKEAMWKRAIDEMALR